MARQGRCSVVKLDDLNCIPWDLHPLTSTHCGKLILTHKYTHGINKIKFLKMACVVGTATVLVSTASA